MVETIFDKLVNIIIPFVLAACLCTLLWLNNADEATEQKRMEMYCDHVAAWELDRDMGIGPYDRKGHPNFNRVDCGEVMK